VVLPEESFSGLKTDFIFENGTCAEGYNLAKGGQSCIRGADRIDRSSQTISMSTCDGTRGRNGLIFCNIYAAFTGSRNKLHLIKLAYQLKYPGYILLNCLFVSCSEILSNTFPF
jgi:hypothetical protein